MFIISDDLTSTALSRFDNKVCQPTIPNIRPMKHLLTLCAAFSIFCAETLAAEKPMNIVVLYADDWRYDTLGCAGNPVVKTPNLDRLASEGVRFTHTCVTTSICGVSRASLFTGQWMSRHGNPAFDDVQDAVGGNVSRPAAGQRLLRRPRRQVAQRQVPRGELRLRPRLLRHALDRSSRTARRSTSRRRTKTTRWNSSARARRTSRSA